LGGWVEPAVFNLNETSCMEDEMEDEEDKGDRTQCCNPYLEPCGRCGIYGRRQHHELRTFAKAGETLHGSTLERIFVVRGMQALLRHMLVLVAWRSRGTLREFRLSVPRFGGTDAWSFRKEPIGKISQRLYCTFLLLSMEGLRHSAPSNSQSLW
jgi:hypothetical protein